MPASLACSVNLDKVWEFLNSQSVGAALGAGLAFVLLSIGTRIGRRDNKKTLRKRVEILLKVIPAKRVVIQGELDGLHVGNVSGAPILRFPVEAFREMQNRCLRSLSLDEAIGYDALVYWMQAIDQLLAHAEQECHAIVEAVQKHNRPYGDLKPELDRARDFYGDALRNLDYLEGFAQDILKNKPERIQTTAITRG